MLQEVQTIWAKYKPVINKVLLVAFFVFCGAALQKTFQHEESTYTNTLQVQPTTKYTTNGQVHNVVEVRELTKEEMRHLTDSLRSTIKGKPEIKEVIKLVTTIDTEFIELPVIQYGDTAMVEKNDNYVAAKAIINLKTNKGSISLYLTDTLTQVRTFRKRFLRANKSTIDIINTNPYVEVAAGTAVVVKEPKVLFVVGPSVIYNPFSGTIQYGIGVTFNMLSIKSCK